MRKSLSAAETMLGMANEPWGGREGGLEEVLWRGRPPCQVSLVYRAYLQETAPETESAEQARDSCLLTVQPWPP